MKLIFAFVLILTSSSAFGAVVIYNNRVFGEVVAPIYGVEATDPTLSLRGNTPTGTPTGLRNYSGALLDTPNYTIELWSAPEATPGNLSPVPGSLRSFRSDRPGFINATPSIIDIPGFNTGDRAFLQLRVWDNTLASSWTDVELNSSIARGLSDPFLSLPLGGPNVIGPDTLPPAMVGLTSFNVFAPVPEPTSVAAAFALIAYAAFRRLGRGRTT